MDSGYEKRELEAFLILSAASAGYVFAQVLREPITTSPTPFFSSGDPGTRFENSLIDALLKSVLLLTQTQNTREALSTIKFNFSLNHSQLADVLRVTRPAVYAWLDEEAQVRIQPHNQRRIEQLASYAEFWWEKAGRRFPRTLQDSKLGAMLLDLFRAEMFDDQLIRWAIVSLSAQLPVERQLETVKGVGPVPTDEALTIEEIADA